MSSMNRLACNSLLSLLALILAGVCSARLRANAQAPQPGDRQPSKPPNAQLVDAEH